MHSSTEAQVTVIDCQFVFHLSSGKLEIVPYSFHVVHKSSSIILNQFVVIYHEDLLKQENQMSFPHCGQNA